MGANPKKAVNALLPRPVRCGDIEVKPLTLGMWAALESIDSPLITGKEPRGIIELVPSLYLLTHDPRLVFSATLMADAMAWADSVPVDALERIKAACDGQMRVVSNILPGSDDGGSKPKKTTGRSLSSQAGRPATSNGPTLKSCGKRRSRS